MRKIVTTAVVSMLALSQAVIPSFALQAREGGDRKQPELSGKMVALKENAKSKRCENASTVVERVKSRHSDHKMRVGQIQSRFVEQVSKLSAKLKEAGFDTSVVDEKAETLRSMMEELGVLVDQKVTKMEELKTSACESDSTDLSALRAELKTLQKDIVAKSKEIKDFYSTELKPALKELREEVRTERAKLEEEKEESEDKEEKEVEVEEEKESETEESAE